MGLTAFEGRSFAEVVGGVAAHARELYLDDEIPWVVGYSGGKDSTATLQLVWLALSELDPSERHKPVHVISTDTLVENPVVAAWVNHSLEVLGDQAIEQELPIVPHRLTPAITDSFWVNLIGKGYPAPRPKFRWCTERLKIKPSNSFIHDVVKQSGEAIVVLGTRKAESAARARTMSNAAKGRMRDRLSPNQSLPNSLVYTPIEDWSNDDVWLYLMQEPNPWGYENKDLLTMYQGASEDGECPLVVDTSTPSCGDSRFGCWTCTLVDQDKSMAAMIQNDAEKEWMQPLLDVRNALDMRDSEGARSDYQLRDFRRMNGAVQLFHRRGAEDSEERTETLIHGPYTQQAREDWLRRVLEAQKKVRNIGPPEVGQIELISQGELEEIRRIWVAEKHEFEDTLPGIYEECAGQPFDGPNLDEHLPLGAEEVQLLREICGDDRLHFELVRELLDVERRHRAQVRRAGLFDELEAAIRRGFFDSAEDALERAVDRRSRIEATEGDDLAGTPIDEYIQLAAGGSKEKEKPRA
jgi:DNA sulfur modification protein DndC